jgi:hypothetical protein
MDLQNFVYITTGFLATALKRDKHKIGVRVGGKEV